MLDRRHRKLIAWAENRKWEGSTGRSDKLVMIALCQRAERKSVDKFLTTNRQLTELTGLSRKTVRKAIERHIERELIAMSERTLEGTFYRIKYDRIVLEFQDFNDSLEQTILHKVQNHDAFRNKALHLTSALVYAAIQKEPSETMKRVTDQVECSYGTVRKAIKLLEQADLICFSHGAWRPSRPFDPKLLDKIAEIAGTSGTLDRIKAFHKKESMDYKSYLEQKGLRWEAITNG